MPSATSVTYGEGGFDPRKPNNNIISTRTKEDVLDYPAPPPDFAALATALIASPSLDQPTKDAIAAAFKAQQQVIAPQGL